MKRITLTPLQIDSINRWIEMSVADQENYLLEKYGVFGIEELPATEYDEIIKDIQEFLSR